MQVYYYLHLWDYLALGIEGQRQLAVGRSRGQRRETQTEAYYFVERDRNRANESMIPKNVVWRIFFFHVLKVSMHEVPKSTEVLLGCADGHIITLCVSRRWRWWFFLSVRSGKVCGGALLLLAFLLWFCSCGAVRCSFGWVGRYSGYSTSRSTFHLLKWWVWDGGGTSVCM